MYFVNVRLGKLMNRIIKKYLLGFQNISGGIFYG
jgi:hypothetical protein